VLRIGIDFDGTIAEGKPLRLFPYVKAALARMKSAGNHLVLFSGRCATMDPAPALEDEVGRFYSDGDVPPRVVDQWDRFDEMRTFLKVNGLWGMFDEVWQAPGKPALDVIIDNASEQPDWLSLCHQFGVKAGAA